MGERAMMPEHSMQGRRCCKSGVAAAAQLCVWCGGLGLAQLAGGGDQARCRTGALARCALTP